MHKTNTFKFGYIIACYETKIITGIQERKNE